MHICRTTRRSLRIAIWIAFGAALTIASPGQSESDYIIGPATVRQFICNAPRAVGMAVERLDHGTPLHRAGVPVGALIVRYGQFRVTKAREIQHAIQSYAGHPVDVEVLLPLRVGERTRRSGTFRVTAVRKDERPQGLPRAFFLCVVAPRRESGRKTFELAHNSVEAFKRSLERDPVAEQSTIEVLEKPDGNGLSTQDLLAKIGEISARAKPNDAVIVFFVGHGGYDPGVLDGSEGHYLEVGSGDNDGRFVWRATLLKALPARVRLRGLITETCFTLAPRHPPGKSVQVYTETRVVEREIPTPWQRLFLHSFGVVDINGCRKGQICGEDPTVGARLGEDGFPDKGIGVFSTVLNDGLQSTCRNWEDAMVALRRATIERFRTLRGMGYYPDVQSDQEPQIFSSHAVTTKDVPASKGATSVEWTVEGYAVE